LKIANLYLVKDNNSKKLKKKNDPHLKPGGQLNMMINFFVKFDSWSNTFLAMSDTKLKLQILTKSRAIILHILNTSRSKTAGAQLHVMINITEKSL
jgi:hypothetical protein